MSYLDPSQRNFYTRDPLSNIEIMERAPSPPEEPPPPRPFPREASRPALRPMSTTSMEEPPTYVSVIPKPFMSGFMEKASGEFTGKVPLWSRKFVEVSGGFLTFHESREPRDPSSAVTLCLADSYVSLQDRRVIRLESNTGIRLFRPASEVRANKWFYVISCFCSVAPTAEGFCKKLSSRKKILEDRYVKLTAEGILSWYKNEDDTDSRGNVQVRGETISTDVDEANTVYLHTEGRRYHLQFLNKDEASMWLNVLEWHAQRDPNLNPSVPVRNSRRNIRKPS